MKILNQKEVNSEINDILKKISKYLKIEKIVKDTVICGYEELGYKFYIIFKGSVSILLPKEYNYKINLSDYFEHLIILQNFKENQIVLDYK